MRHSGGQSLGIFRCFGDSITNGTAASPITNGYAYLLATALARTVPNFGTSGDMVTDQTSKVYSIKPAFGDISTIMLGVNDERIYGVNSTTLSYYRRGLQCLAAYLGLGIKQYGITSGTYTGTWVNTTPYGIGKNSATNGSTATFTVTGTTVYLGMIQQDAAPGNFDVKIDGTTVGSFTTQTTGLGPSVNGISYGAMLLRFPGLSSGAHTVQIIVTSATAGANTVYIDWVAGNAQTVKPVVYVGNVTYAQAYTTGGSSANVDSYNAAISSLVSELVADGLKIVNVNTNVLNLSVDMDGAYHPVNSGHVKLATAFESAFI